MDSFWIITILIFAIVGLSYFVGRKSKEQDLEMEAILQEQEAREKALKIEKETVSRTNDSIRSELRDEAGE